MPALPHVGRLDNDTSGLLLLTDDGQLAARLLQKVAPNKETLGSASVDDAQTLEVETPAATSKPPDAVDEYAHSPSCSRIKREEELSGVSKEYLVDVLPGKGVKFMHGGRINVKVNSVAGVERIAVAVRMFERSPVRVLGLMLGRHTSNIMCAESAVRSARYDKCAQACF